VWLKELGESVAKGDPLVEVETEKAVLEMEALDSGVLVEIISGVGTEILVGAVIGYLETED
jgi:pyruvate dehydrogenase E2 component (dihydrolipoamide acetyltransferase)